MKRFLSVSLAAGLLASVSIGATVSWGASQDTGCWDEYNVRGTRMYRTVTPKDLSLGDCTPGVGCFAGYNRYGKQNRIYVPHQAKPSSACEAVAPDTTTSTVVVTLPTPTLPIVPDTTVAPTLPPDTTVAPTPTTTIVVTPPDTTVAPTPTLPIVVTPPDTTVAPTPTLPPTVAPTSGEFVGTFDGNSGLDRLTYGVYHRGMGEQVIGQAPVLRGGGLWGDRTGTWTGDHDLTCGSPDSQRPLSSTKDDFNVDEVVYLCRDHVMTSMGNVDGYSIVWFSPDGNRDGIADVFNDVTTVSWDVNVTDLGSRQWWEVSIVPVGAPFLATVDWMARVANIASYDTRSVVVGNGPAARAPKITTGGQERYTDHRRLCGDYAHNPEACGSKATRLQFSMTDNRNGTITVDYGGIFTQTVPGQFPADGFSVYFKDHNYTPDKDGPVVGHTWHWDNIIVR